MYFDLVTKNDSFYILESLGKPKTGGYSAIDILSKIETVLKNNFKYDCSHQDTHSGKCKSELYELLKEKSSEIQKGYSEKVSKLSWIMRKLFGKEKKINTLATSIGNYVKPAKLLDLSHDVIKYDLAQFLGVSDLASLARQNRTGRALVIDQMVKRAQKFGYEGNDSAEAVNYIKELFKEVKHFSGAIPKKLRVYRSFFKLDPEKTLLNLENISTEDLFNLLSDKDFYSPSNQKFQKFLALQKTKVVHEEIGEKTDRKGAKALRRAIESGWVSMAELLVNRGANPNTREDPSAFPPLQEAILRGSFEITELLLKNSPRANRNSQLSTLLVIACGAVVQKNRYYFRPNVRVIELLINHGADVNIPSDGGHLPLCAAARSGLIDITKLLLDHGARVNELVNRGAVALTYALVDQPDHPEKPKVELINLLIDHGADPYIPDLWGLPIENMRYYFSAEEVARFMGRRGEYIRNHPPT